MRYIIDLHQTGMTLTVGAGNSTEAISIAVDDGGEQEILIDLSPTELADLLTAIQFVKDKLPKPAVGIQDDPNRRYTAAGMTTVRP